jgi:hypothetical protein
MNGGLICLRHTEGKRQGEYIELSLEGGVEPCWPEEGMLNKEKSSKNERCVGKGDLSRGGSRCMG